MKRQRSYTQAIVVAALMMPMVFGCVGPKVVRQQTHLSKATVFVGEWCNKDFDTGGITRVHIRWVDNDLRIHMWGRCHPTECDWGEETATIHGNGELLTVKWNQSFAVHTQELRLQLDGTLEVSSHSHYTDKSGRKDHDNTYHFVKGVVHDWSDQATQR